MAAHHQYTKQWQCIINTRSNGSASSIHEAMAVHQKQWQCIINTCGRIVLMIEWEG
jgi:hypothetical protein